MNNAGAWALVMTLACALSLASVGGRIERGVLAFGALAAGAHVAFTLDRWSAWENSVRHVVYAITRPTGLALDRAMEASLMASVCLVIGALHRAGTAENTAVALRARRAVLAIGALWGLYAVAGFGWVARAM